jgi:hypothetical protein
MIKKAAITTLRVLLNILLYLAMMAVDKNGGALLAFKGLRILLATSLIMMIFCATGLVKWKQI